ncbi:UbiD family decarboxylase domain-containing protein, partial [Enterococcus faecium]|uniref:UbiD family decarboxylase domain-containing protein n=1 Tax=Enterococcus faecium TaxID=1352 RepID=UPI003D6A7409
PMRISINVGLDPAIAIGTTFAPPTTPLGYNELWWAGALRNEPIQIVDGIAVKEVSIARAEYNNEAENMPNETMQEDNNTNSGKAMPEFPGYTGDANPAVQVVKV